MDNSSGPAGEQMAAEYLLAAGYEIVCRNYRTRFGEIDIIAKNSRFLVFAEVKTRSEGALADPLEAVTPSKRRKIVKSAELYLQKFPTRLQPRFDAIGILFRGSRPDIRHIENAFGCGDFF